MSTSHCERSSVGRQCRIDTRFPALIIEDHPLTASATAELLHKAYPHVSPVLVGSAPEAIERAASADWFRIFVDLGVPGATGLSLVRALRALGLAHRCCIITATRDDRLITEAQRLGVLGYIEKTCTMEQFRQAIDDVVRGSPVFPAIAAATKRVPPPQLTARQLTILQLLQKGLSSKQVAYELTIAEGTVKNHTLALLRALRASNRAHAVARGVQLGLLEPTVAFESN